MKSLVRVVFMGTPEFAVASLGSLLMNGYNVVGVVTVPDKPAGRGRIISKSAVKQYAEGNYLPVFQPVNLKDPEFIEALEKLQADIFVVVAFRMLPEVIWRIPKKGTINLHASLLPQYRGAAPINHVIINGEKKTGLTTFFIDDKIDTGNILLRKEVPIYAEDNAGDLHDRLMIFGARLVSITVRAIAEGKIKPVSQSGFMAPGEVLKTAPKIFPENCIINWDNDHIKIHNLIRGLSPYPCARSSFKKQDKSYSFKIFDSQVETAAHSYTPGQIFSDGKTFIKIACRGGFVNILTMQFEGKKKLTVAEFLRGFRISDYYNIIS